MYHFHCSFIKNNFDTELLFTDKERLTYEINQKMFMKNFLSVSICLISVTIQKTQFFYLANKKVIGKMKYVSEGKK